MGVVASPQRLSALDASFLAVDSAAAPMHVGWVATFDGPAPGFGELFGHIAQRLEAAPRYRRRLAPVPFGLHDPVWVDDAGFDPANHVLRAEGADLDAMVGRILSEPLPRDRPLWQMWIADQLPGGGFAMIGKAHHCMVDGAAVAELGKVLLDAEPGAAGGGRSVKAGAGVARRGRSPKARAGEPAAGREPAPSAAARLAQAVADRAADGAALAFAPARLAASPSGLRSLPMRAGALSRALVSPAPVSPLNRPGSARRHHVRRSRPIHDLRTLRRRFGVAPNDVVLAACAGALRRLAERRGEPPRRLKVMVPADLRSAEDDPTGGNRISFVFLELPCDEPDPVERVRMIGAATAQRRRDGDAEHLDAAFGVVARGPRLLQHVLAHAFAHPRLFNLTISSVPGPALPRYLLGCRLREVHSAVPLAARHAVSIGVVTVAGRACFGIYADPAVLPDAERLGDDLDAAFDELLAAA